MTAFETVRRVALDDSVAVELTAWGPDTVTVTVTNAFRAWQGTDREQWHYERIDTDGFTVAELQAFVLALADAVADLTGKGNA